jgi:phage terminase large subunit
LTREVELPNAWTPRDYQLPAWRYLEGGGKRADLVWHRRAGKDDLALHWAAVSAIQKPGTYWHMLPQAEQARKAIWRAIDPHTGMRRIDTAFPESIRRTTRDQEMNIELLNGSLWQVVGSDNYNSLVGSPPIGVVFSEWPLADPSAWAFISPILEENGGWALFNGTPRGPNHGKSLYDHAVKSEGWYAARLTAHDTGVFKPEQLERIREELIGTYGREHGGALFEQEYECSFEAAVIGAYYGRLMADAERDGRITGVSYDPMSPVWTAWDLGVGDPTAIWWAQRCGREIHIIDYYEASGVDLGHFVREINNRPYTYGGHILPHDAQAKELGTGKSREDTLRALNLKNMIFLPMDRIEDGINAVRMLIPRCWFDRRKCERGINWLKLYHSKYDEKLQTFQPKPVHDKSSHGADAFRYLAMGIEELGESRGFGRAIQYEASGIV